MTGAMGKGDRTGTVTPIPLSAQIEMPWKNGGGTTREICKVEDETGILWRASIATIHQSGPFSLFKGCDRIITLIEGPPVALDFVDGELRVLEMFQPQHFSCDRAVSATVTGTSRDLNLIWRRDAVSVECRAIAVRGKTEISLPSAPVFLVVACSGTVEVTSKGEMEKLENGAAVLVNANADAGPPGVTLESENGFALAFSVTQQGKQVP